MQRKNVIRPARERWLAGASVIAGTLLVSACGSSPPAASSSSASASASAPAPASIAPNTSAASAPAEPTPTPTPTAAVTPTKTINPGGTNAGAGPTTDTCPYRAAHDAYIYITKVASAASGALTLTGQDAKLVCGGPDDFHWNTVTATETGHTVPAVSISVFPVSKMGLGPQPIKPGQLAAYLKTDEDTRIFLVGGPLSAITSLQEQFHP